MSEEVGTEERDAMKLGMEELDTNGVDEDLAPQ